MLRFLKKWSLAVAITAGAGLYLLFAKTPCLAASADVLGPWCVRALPASLFLTLFVTFSKVDFRGMAPRLWHFAVLATQLAGVALLAWAALRLSPDAPEWWSKPVLEAALVCVIAPCATATPVVVAKLGGDLAQSTSFTLLSSLSAALLIPAVFPALEPDGGATFWATSSAILRKLSLVLLLPLALGAIVHFRIPRLRRWIEARPDLGFQCWCVSLALTAGLTAKNLLHSAADAPTLAAIAALSLSAAALQFAAGRLLGRLFGSPVCAAQAMFQKNTGLAIWIAYVYLTPAASIGAGCYVLWQNIINSWELWQHRRKGTR